MNKPYNGIVVRGEVVIRPIQHMQVHTSVGVRYPDLTGSRTPKPQSAENRLYMDR